MKLSKWGAFGLVLGAGAFAVHYGCRRLTHNPASLCVILYAVLLLCALGCGILAARRGNKGWLLMSICAGLLLAQTALAIIVGD